MANDFEINIDLLNDFESEQGTQGIQGTQGPQGIQGITGTQGSQGTRGAQGPQGIQGVTGTQGSQGAQGERGPKGPVGLQGATGQMGGQGISDAKGLQGPQGTKGASGVQGIQGTRGANGAQGTRGASGTQGTRGASGAQGTSGENGAQGAQGTRGANGPQGTRGCEGAQGPAGSKGVQGPAGTRGEIGPQGQRGCEGAQGPAGSKGVQGPQGARGESGAQGRQGGIGETGYQGAQGTKGTQGPKGTIGYRGDDGEIGYQGITGEDGAVWYDGIRLNGYNTHLFGYKGLDDKFEPVDGQNNLLRLRDGAVIRLWLNRAGYNSIVNSNSQIKIDKVENNQYVETSYPAYYTDGVLITQKITESDLNGVIEFTFKENGWYYNGGLIGAGGSGGGGATENVIKVSGVSIGGYNTGDSIPAGTQFETIFRTMLSKTIDVKANTPKASKHVINEPPNVIEVGTYVSFTLGMNYVDGYFTSSDTEAYTNEEFNRINETTGGKLNAGCNEGAKTYSLNGSVIQSPEIVNLGVEERVYNYTGNVAYGNSSVIARMNNGENSSVRISASSININLVSFTGKYKCFYGYTATIPSMDYSNVFTDKASLNTLSNKWLDSETYAGEYDADEDAYLMTSTQDKQALVVVLPEYYKIYSTRNSLGQLIPVDEKWIKQNDLYYTNDGETTKYEVYVLHSNIPITYKEILIKKKNS